MNDSVRKFFVISIKSAVNAVLVTAPTLGIAPGSFHFHNRLGIEHIAMEFGAAILAREMLIWGPKLMAWSQSPTNGYVAPVPPPPAGGPLNK